MRDSEVIKLKEVINNYQDYHTVKHDPLRSSIDGFYIYKGDKRVSDRVWFYDEWFLKIQLQVFGKIIYQGDQLPLDEGINLIPHMKKKHNIKLVCEMNKNSWKYEYAMVVHVETEDIYPIIGANFSEKMKLRSKDFFIKAQHRKNGGSNRLYPWVTKEVLALIEPIFIEAHQDIIGGK